MLLKMSPSYYIIIGIIIVSFLTFLPAFSLTLFGDDWMTFWRYLQYFGPNSLGEWNHLSYFLTAYGPQDMLMGTLQKIYGFNSFYYQLTSFLLRLVASFSLYPVAWYLTKSKLAAFWASLFFSITTIGLETTAWVFNLPSFIGISFLNLFFYFYLKSHFEQNIKLLVLAGFLFAIVFILQPIRMHGLLPFIIMMELFWVFQQPSKMFKQFLFRIYLFIAIFMAIFIIFSKSPVAPTVGVSNEIITNLSKLISQGKINFLLNPLKTLGSIFVPLPVSFNLYLTIGGIAVLVWVLLIIKFRKDKKIDTALFFSFAWLISSFIIAWLRAPDAILTSTHRYLIVSAVGLALSLACLISISKSKNYRTLSYLVALTLILINITSTRTYLRQQEQTHSITISNKIWALMPKINAIGKEEEPHIFYFEGDGQNATIIRDVITFGFPPHMSLIYNLSGREHLPVPMSEWQDLLNAVSTGKGMNAFGYQEIAVDIGKVYAFKLSGPDQLTDITANIREKLEALKNQ